MSKLHEAVLFFLANKLKDGNFGCPFVDILDVLEKASLTFQKDHVNLG